MNDNTQISQTQLKMTWLSMLQQGLNLPSFRDVQFSLYSQNGEDGILLYIFTLIGTTNRKVLEICAGDGINCNSTNLITNQGWHGLLFDGNNKKLDRGREFYRKDSRTSFWPPNLQSEWITKDNINDLVSSNYFEGEIDLLSIDLDGNDYWIFDALDVVQPRVVVAEYQAAWGPDMNITQRYQEDFDWSAYQKENIGHVFTGASLGALAEAADRKGLRLVGCEPRCINAFFVRKGLAEDLLPTMEPSACFDHPMAKFNIARINDSINPEDPFWVKV